MMNPEVLSVVEKRVVQDIEDRHKALSHELAQLWANMSARGVLQSSMTVMQSLDAIGNEFRVRVSLVWNALARALDAKRIVLTETLTSEVKERLADLLDNTRRILQSITKRLCNSCQDYPHLNLCRN
jgi:predicted methyltransferase MtxX (methanogen marker protein 4)